MDAADMVRLLKTANMLLDFLLEVLEALQDIDVSMVQQVAQVLP